MAFILICPHPDHCNVMVMNQNAAVLDSRVISESDLTSVVSELESRFKTGRTLIWSETESRWLNYEEENLC